MPAVSNEAEPNNDWWARAKCRGLDPDLFVFDKDDRKSAAAAKRICNGYIDLTGYVEKPCPVRDECLAYAMDERIYTNEVWGGTGSRDRRKLAPKWRRENG